MLLAQWCSEILNRSNCAGALHWSDIFVRRELRGAKVNSDCVRKKSLANYLLKVRNVERVEQGQDISVTDALKAVGASQFAPVNK